MYSFRSLCILPAVMGVYAYSAEIAPRSPVPDQANVVIPDQKILNQTEKPNPKHILDTLPEQDLAVRSDALEKSIARKVVRADSEGLAEELARYRTVANRDPSLIEWGEAILAARNGDLRQSIRLYRKINSALPDVDLVRFQMAMALFADQQFVAAQDEFERLRSKQSLPKSYLEAINRYLDAISRQSQWNFNAGLNYTHDQNINSVPPKGTKITFPNGSVVSSDKDQLNGNGIQFDASADKRWALPGHFFSAVHLSGFGKLYWDEKTYNDLLMRAAVGLGYSDATTEVELQPFYQHRWYVNRDENDTKFDHYNNAWGLRLDLSQWLTPQVRYQGGLEWKHNHFTAQYGHLNGNDWLFSNTLLYLRNPKQYWFAGLDFNRHGTHSASSAYKRAGIRLGWGQEWGKGISTRASIGYGKKIYDEADFFGIRQKSNEYSTSLSIWNRNWHYWGITPRLTWSYHKTDGNHKFYNYDDQNLFLEFTKKF